MPKHSTPLHILVSPTDPGQQRHAGPRLAEEAKKMNIPVKLVLYTHAFETYKKQKPAGVILRITKPESSFTPLRKKYIQMVLKDGGHLLNARSFLVWHRFGKWIQYQYLKKTHIPCVPTKPCSRKYKPKQYPFVIKPNYGACGKGVRKIRDTKEWKTFLAENRASNFITQPMMREGEDLRVLVLNGEILGAMQRRAAPGKFTANFSQGGSVTAYDIFSDQEACDLVLKTARLFRVDYAGIDLIKDHKNHWRVLEVNRSAQFKGFEMATGTNVARAIIQCIKEKMETKKEV